MLLCFDSNEPCMHLFDALEMRPSLYDHETHTMSWGGEYFSYVFHTNVNREAYLSHLDWQDRVILVGFSLEDQNPNVVTAWTVDELEEFMCILFDPDAKSKISSRIFFKDAPPPPILKLKRHRCSKCVACQVESTCIMLNCGHECMCEGCADRWLAEKKECPICKAAITVVYN